MKAPRIRLIFGFLFATTIGIFAVAAQDAPKRAAPRGRLPAHFKDLVSPDQREQIYVIQSKYNSEIDELEAKIEKLKKERDAEVVKVLTPAQQARLKLLLDGKDKTAGGEKPKADQPAAEAARGDKKDVFPK
jgi:hypothetical protein